jgi:hypothetical protein
MLVPSIQALLGRLEQKYDVVHLMCDVTQNGAITTSGREITGTELIQNCCDQNVKSLLLLVMTPTKRKARVK